VGKAELFRRAYANNTRQFTRTDGKTGTLELGGEQQVIDGTNKRTITVEFHIMSNKHMSCDALLGSDAMKSLTRKYGVSYNNCLAPLSEGPA
jgi:hypothetical protein